MPDQIDETAAGDGADTKAETARRRPARKVLGETPATAPAPKAGVEIGDPAAYLNRELTWLNFNFRVLHEARDSRNPLLERLKFLAITNSNLDEFFMKRIGGLKQQVGAGVHDLTVDGRSPQQQLLESGMVVEEMRVQQREVFQDLMGELRRAGIVIAAYDELKDDEKIALRRHYIRNIFPLVTPLAMDPAHPFPFISNLSLNLLVTLHHPDEYKPILARVKIPVGFGVKRFHRVGDTGENRFVLLDDIIANNLDLLFPDMVVESVEYFRVTRNANTERDEEQADDLLSMIETELRERKFAPIVRLETREGMTPIHKGMLAAELGLSEEDDVFETDVMLGMRDLMELAFLDMPSLRDPSHHPINNVDLQDKRNVFHIIREAGTILLSHPYESFGTSVERFVREASQDPKVLAIKMTLYRTSEGTRIIDYLIDAALNGKQVLVCVELKARFDEEANIRWASRLEEVGVHVTYGVVGLKTHSKAILVVRQDYNGLRRYAHIGTGNYHAGTARIYCDLGILTSDTVIGRDLTELFNYLTTGVKPARRYRKLLVAPKHLKGALLAKIEREIALHSEETPGLIRLKCNGLEDIDIVDALYRASRAGVTVKLVVRDTCRLRPGIPGLSDTISVVSVVGRFLEHTRIYHFRNGGNDEYLIGSADLMRRNLMSRVEVVTPVDAPGHRAMLDEMLEIQLADQRNAWDMRTDGSYLQRRGRSPAARGCHLTLMDAAEVRHSEANRLRKRKVRAVARRSVK